MQQYKQIRQRLIGLMSLVAALAATEASSVGAVLNYAPGDLILGFRKTGAANDYVVNLGPSSAFTAGGGTFVVNLGDLGADLSTAGLFGAGWGSDATVFWSVSGATGLSGANGEPARTLFATKAELPLGTVLSPWDAASATTQSAPDSKMRTMGSAIAGLNSTANSNFALIQSTGATSSYASFQNPGVSSFSYYPAGIEGSLAAGTDALSLFRDRPITGGGPGEYLGTFTLTDAGVLSFTPVPEPTGMALVSLCAAVAIGTRRRKN